MVLSVGMLSVKVTVKSRLLPGKYVALAGAVTEEMVGADLSIVTVLVASELAAGPLLLVTIPKTELARSLGVRVPSLHPVMLIVKVEPEEELGVKIQPVALPALVKSVDTTLLTFCEKLMEYEIVEEVFVGED